MSKLLDSANDRSANTATTGDERILKRYQSKDLFRTNREIKIEHQGRIYRMRVTQLNKLILTA